MRKAEKDGKALRAAASKGREAVVQLLLDRRAGINEQGIAALQGYDAMMQILADSGIEMNAKGDVRILVIMFRWIKFVTADVSPIVLSPATPS